MKVAIRRKHTRPEVFQAEKSECPTIQSDSTVDSLGLYPRRLSGYLELFVLIFSSLHPVHDQYTSTAGEPTKTTDHTPHFSNSSSLNPVGASTGYGSSAQQGGSTLGSSVRPGTTPARPNPMEEESTASIKSGIIGLPQGGQHHETPTASRGFEATLPDRTIARYAVVYD